MRDSFILIYSCDCFKIFIIGFSNIDFLKVMGGEEGNELIFLY